MGYIGSHKIFRRSGIIFVPFFIHSNCLGRHLIMTGKVHRLCYTSEKIFQWFSISFAIKSKFIYTGTPFVIKPCFFEIIISIRKQMGFYCFHFIFFFCLLSLSIFHMKLLVKVLILIVKNFCLHMRYISYLNSKGYQKDS